jgi:hypothetical protein
MASKGVGSPWPGPQAGKGTWGCAAHWP